MKDYCSLPDTCLGYTTIRGKINNKELLLQNPENEEFFIFTLKDAMKKKIKYKDDLNLLIWQYTKDLFVIDETYDQSSKIVYIGTKVDWIHKGDAVKYLQMF